MEVAYGIHVGTRLVVHASKADRPGFDRDLSVAGRVMIKTKEGQYAQRLVRIDKPSMFCCVASSLNVHR